MTVAHTPNRFVPASQGSAAEHASLRVGLLAVMLVITGCTAVPGDGTQPDAGGSASRTGAVTVTLVADDLEDPVGGAAIPGTPWLYILELPGRVRLIRDGVLERTPVLDITDRVLAESPGERGLVGIALHPSFESNGRVFLAYTGLDTDLVVVEYKTVGGDFEIDPAAAVEILRVDQPGRYHHGGTLVFGPDGYLWIGLGDGGDPFGDVGVYEDEFGSPLGPDPFGHGQDPATLQGTIVRIDVAATSEGPDGTVRNYSVPDDNPFVGADSGAAEVWAYGLRNPWRLTFDGAMLYIADVGENRWDEINVLPIAESAGRNFGWSVYEGNECTRPSGCDLPDHVDPIVVLPNAEGCAVIGGPVYRGRAIPELVGRYLYADFCFGWIRSLHFGDGTVDEHLDWTEELGARPLLTSFITDGDGEVYFVTLSGHLYRLDPLR